jgi:DNA-binding transcriptional LysR family regulator
MPIQNWDEIRTAYCVAKMGTVSGAAEMLGVHHATVIRHVDALEGRLGVKLFQRHARGYTPTEAGSDLFQVAQATADQFAQLAGRLHGHGQAVTGELVVTSIDTLSPLLAPVLTRFQRENPELSVRFLSDTRLFRLEYGEAHVAVRAGPRPTEPDNIVQALHVQPNGLYASGDYVALHGVPDLDGDLAGHRFVGTTDETPRAPFDRWMAATVPTDRITYRCTRIRERIDAVEAGAGIGFVPLWRARLVPELVQIAPPRGEWDVPLWLITHVDLHRTAKVQSFTAFLKEAAKAWPQR